MSGSHPPRPISFHTNLPPPNTNFSIAKPFYTKPRPLDKSGAPCRKWSKHESEVPTLSGHGFSMKGWKPTANSPKEAVQHHDIDNPATADSDKPGTREYNSSPLSSAIDMDEEMYDTADRAVDPADDTESEDAAANEDRLQEQLDGMFNQNTKTTRSPVLDSTQLSEAYDFNKHADIRMMES